MGHDDGGEAAQNNHQSNKITQEDCTGTCIREGAEAFPIHKECQEGNHYQREKEVGFRLSCNNCSRRKHGSSADYIPVKRMSPLKYARSILGCPRHKSLLSDC